MSSRLAPLAGALALDAAFGEPPNTFHPVAWLGQALDWFERQAPKGRSPRFWYGAFAALALPAFSAAVGWCLERTLPWWLHAFALKPAFAGRALLDAGHEVERALEAGKLTSAQAGLAALVSRDTGALDEGLAAAAAIESMVENLTDSWVAPLLAYALFGLPGAYAYRAVNTADAMWGYRTPRYEWLGKAAARLDDALNVLPARLGALSLMLIGRNRWGAFNAWWRDRGTTASPNAGQTMAAAAGALQVRLEKVGHYVLNPGGHAPAAQDVRAARALVGAAMIISAIFVAAVSGWRDR